MANTSIYNAFERMWQHINNKFATKSAQDASLTEAKAYADAAVASLVDSSPEALNTLNELAAALGNDPNFATTVLTELGKKAYSTDLAPVAFSGDYDDLENKLELLDSVESTSRTKAATPNSVKQAYDLAAKANEKVPLIQVTYSELAELRNNEQLVPGMFYRITNYRCTTAQENTRAQDNQFDIIVQALSTSTLSENASADYHIADRTEGIIPTLRSSVTSSPVSKSIVVPYYYEYIDSDSVSELKEYRRDLDIFIEFDYLQNNEGVTVPVIYKTDVSGVRGDSEYADADTDDIFYYVGAAEVDGIAYDKWRKIDEEYTWDSDWQVYVYTNILVENNSIIYDSLVREIDINNSSDVDTDIPHCRGMLVENSIISHYREYVDFDFSNEDYAELIPEELAFVTYDYLKYKNSVVPVIYDFDLGGENDGDAFYYVGTAEIDGVTYDKWRKIEGEGSSFDLNSDSKLYYYTDVVVENGFPFGDSAISDAVNILAWELKYCLDNDTSRFAWADEENGRGVIYWMRDEHGNECPYDFKNIQFKLTDDWKTKHPEFVEAHGIENIEWFYTFSEIVDGEALEATTRNSEYDFIVHNNIIKMLYDEKYAILSATVMFASSDGGTHGNYIYNRHPYQTVTVLGERCCNNNINAHNITMAKDSNNNILNNCYNIYAATAIYNSEIKDNSSYIKIISSSTGVKNITIGRNINGRSVSPIIINVAQTNNEPIIYSAPNTKEIILDI